MKVWRSTLLAAVVTACSAPAVQTADDPAAKTEPVRIAPPQDAARVLEQARQQAEAKQGAVIALLQADWCQPCNELQLRVMETNDGKALAAKHVVAQFDYDEPLGGAVASALHVLGLPTTVILRPVGGKLEEFARIEGFEEPGAWKAALQQGLARTKPAPMGCANADDRQLDARRPADQVLADAECLAMELTTPQASGPAAKLHAFLVSPEQLSAAASWPDDARGRLVGVVQTLGRYESRVAQQQKQAAELFASIASWSGVPGGAVAGLVFWHARCLAKAGDAAGAERVLDAYIAKEKGSVAARELAADLMVHEHVAPARAKQLLAALLQEDPGDHWAHYLAGELATQQGDRDGARKHLAAANHLKPGVALYMRHYLRVSGDTTRQE